MLHESKPIHGTESKRFFLHCSITNIFEILLSFWNEYIRLTLVNTILAQLVGCRTSKWATGWSCWGHMLEATGCWSDGYSTYFAVNMHSPLAPIWSSQNERKILPKSVSPSKRPPARKHVVNGKNHSVSLPHEIQYIDHVATSGKDCYVAVRPRVPLIYDVAQMVPQWFLW